MTDYKLVNPTIVGSFDSTVEAGSADKAVKTLWNRLSEHIVGNVPSINVTIQEGGSNKLHHYNIKEKVDDEDNASILINKLNVKMTSAQATKFLAKAEKVTSQAGSGKKLKVKRRVDDSDDSDSDSDSESDDEYFRYLKRRRLSPINLYWYTPYLYPRRSVYVPVWRRPIFAYNRIHFFSINP